MKKSAALLIIGSYLVLPEASCADQAKAAIAADPAVCEALDFEAIKLTNERRLGEAGDVLDKAIAACTPDASRLTSRGVLFAAQGEKSKAEDEIKKAIQLAESQGDQCRADLSRAELTVIRGGKKLATAPASCKRPRSQ